MANLTVQEILSSLEAADHNPAATTKTAGVSPQNDPVGASRRALTQALQVIEGGGGQQKQAAQASYGGGADVTGDLQKMAAALEAADSNYRQKEAELYGAAVFDAFISRANQYAEAAGGGQHQHAQQTKYAAEAQQGAAMIKQAASQGAADAHAVLKLAAAEASAAQDDGLEEAYASLEKTAEVCHSAFNAGYSQTDELLQYLAAAAR